MAEVAFYHNRWHGSVTLLCVQCFGVMAEIFCCVGLDVILCGYSTCHERYPQAVTAGIKVFVVRASGALLRL